MSFNWNEVCVQASVLYFTLLWFGPFVLVFTYPIILWRYPWLWLVAIPYLCWVYSDTKIAFKGGRKNTRFFKFAVFRYIREYFSAKLIKTADIPADKNYIFALYPHALMASSAVTNFLVNQTELDELFPGIDFRFVTLNVNLYMPIVREHILPLGACSSSEKSILNLLNRKPATAVILLPGGAAEAGNIRPGRKCEIIKRHKGFVRVALKTGTSLVPVFCFGENYIYDRVVFKKPWVLRFLDAFHKYTGLIFVLPKRCGNNGTIFSFFPGRVPLSTVIGQPIQVPKVANPSQELINEYHKKFFDALVELFEKNREEYDVCGKEAELVFL